MKLTYRISGGTVSGGGGGTPDDGSVSTAKIVDLAVTTGKLAANAVTAAKIADTTITSTQLASNAVTNAKLAGNAVTTAKIQDGQVTAVKCAADVATQAELDAVAAAKANINAPTFTGNVSLTGGTTFTLGDGTHIGIGNFWGTMIGQADSKFAFYGATPQGKQTITGSRGGNAALASLLTALANLGLFTDGTTA